MQGQRIFSEEEDSFEIFTDPDDFSAVRLALEEAGNQYGRGRGYDDSADLCRTDR